MRRFGYCLLVASLSLCGSAALAAEPQWIEVRSPNFSVVTDAGEKRGRAVALHFEQMRSVFGALMTQAKVNLTVPMQIVAFRNTKEMRQVAPIFNGKPTELAGLFQGGEDRSFIMLDMSVENPWSVVFHEYAHRLMDGNLSIRTDPWFEEGFAEYFSSIEVDDKQARVGKIPDQTYQILQQTGLMKVVDLLRVQQYTKTYNESGDRRTTFYAQSGLVVHYLYDNQLLIKLADYFDALKNQNMPVDQALQKSFGMSADQFDKALRTYLNSGHYRYYAIATPAGIVPDQFTVAPVSLTDARALIADIHAHSPDYQEKALSEFQEVLKLDANNASALRGLGFTYLQRRDFPHAAEYLKRAAELDSKDPRVHYYHAMLLNQGGRMDESKTAEMKKELQTAITLDPKLADAYSLLGFAQAMSGELEKGLENTKRSIELAPREERYQFNLANIYMMNRKMDEAIAIFRALSGSENPEVATHASQALAQAQEFKNQTVALRRRESSEPADTAGESGTSLVQESPAETAPALRHRPSSEGVVTVRESGASGVQDPPAETAPSRPAPLRFVKGKLAGVDCSAEPAALLTVISGAKSFKLHVRDHAHVIVIGADQFSCDWKGKPVAVNFRERPDGDGDVVSVEIQ